MSPPVGYGVHHLLNPWMTWHESVDVGRALAQWQGLVDAVELAGGKVELAEPNPESGAMTFTRDTAVVAADGVAVVLRNVGRRGDVEPGRIAAWLAEHGFAIEEPAEQDRLDGGNVVAAAGRWLIGMPSEARRPELDRLADVLAARSGHGAVGVPLVQARYGHLDLALADLGGRAWLAYPPALGAPDLTDARWQRVLDGRPVVAVDDDEARRLACNVVVVGETVIGGGLTPRLCRAIEQLGLCPVPVALDEFRKAGGGAHCLTLELFGAFQTHERRETPWQAT